MGENHGKLFMVRQPVGKTIGHLLFAMKAVKGRVSNTTHVGGAWRSG